MEYEPEALERLALDKFVLNDFVEDERGFVAFQSFSLDKKKDEDSEEDALVTYYTEELVAQVLGYGRKLAEAQAKGLVKDAVITVPAHYNLEQRLLLKQSAELAGLNVIQLVHENTAAATMYGIDRLDADQDLKVLIYNMGGRDTEVSVVNYSAVTDARNKTYEHVEILAEAFDETLGGKQFDDVLVQILANKFNSMKERQGKQDVRENARAMKRLYKEGSKIKDILSANKIVDVKIPELLDYVTLQFKLSRDEFYEACEPLFARVAIPVEQALAQAGLTSE